jgi:hypothetical protein
MSDLNDRVDQRWLTKAVKRAASRSWEILSGVVGFSSAALSVWASGEVGPVLLRVVAVLAIVTLLILLANEFLVRERGRIVEERDKVTLEANRYRDILRRLIDRQGLNYEESLHIHAYIGTSDDEDRIIEKHVTSPTPRLYYRSLRPVYPSGGKLTFEELECDVQIVSGNGVRASLSLLLEDPLRVLVMFDPAVDHPIEWTLAYKPKGLWTPLRKNGVDDMAWDARTPSGRQDEFTFTKFVATFHFPKGVTEAQVNANVTGGQYTEATDPEGCLERTWTYSDKINRRLTWDVTMSPAPPPSVTIK